MRAIETLKQKSKPYRQPPLQRQLPPMNPNPPIRIKLPLKSPMPNRYTRRLK